MCPNNYTIFVPVVGAVIRDNEGRHIVAEPFHRCGVYFKGNAQRSRARTMHFHPNGASVNPGLEAQFEVPKFTATDKQNGRRRSIRSPGKYAAV